MPFSVSEESWQEMQAKAAKICRAAEQYNFQFISVSLHETSPPPQVVPDVPAFLLTTPRVGNLALLKDGSIIEKPPWADCFYRITPQSVSREAFQRVVDHLDEFIAEIDDNT